MWRKEVQGPICNFWKVARAFLELFLKIRGASCKYVGCGLIFEKMRGLSAKCREWNFPGIMLLKENLWTKSTDRWTTPARSTMDRRPLLHAGAHRSSASGRSGARELRPRGGGGEGWADEFNDGVTMGREVVEGHVTGDGASARKGGGEGTVRAKRRSVGGVGVFTEGKVAFYRAEERRGRPGAFNGRR
jgi:hypothetical protein